MLRDYPQRYVIEPPGGPVNTPQRPLFAIKCESPRNCCVDGMPHWLRMDSRTS